MGYPRRPSGEQRDIHYRHGLLMAEFARLSERTETLEHRVEALEGLLDQSRMRRSIRPTVERIGVSAFVAGVVAGIVQGVAQFFR